MKKFFRHIKEDKLLFWSFVISAILMFVTALLIAIFYRNLPAYLPLFNQMPWGYTRIAQKAAFFIPVLIAWVIIGGNSIMCSLMYKKVVLLSRFIGATTIIASLSVLIFTIQILLLIH